jgi:hypothetical protein
VAAVPIASQNQIKIKNKGVHYAYVNYEKLLVTQQILKLLSKSILATDRTPTIT